jgi:predicted nucleic acid-binding protein
MILLDANIFMYAGGAAHPHKAPSLELLRRVATGKVEAVLDAEILQEILYRYRSIGRWSDGRVVYDLAKLTVATVLPITLSVMDYSRILLDQYPALLPRDAVHASVCLVHKLDGICTFDRDFDALGEIKRIDPEALAGEA